MVWRRLAVFLELIDVFVIGTIVSRLIIRSTDCRPGSPRGDTRLRV